MTARYSPIELATALGLPSPTDEQTAVIAAPPGPLVVVAGAGAGKTETMAARVVWDHPGDLVTDKNPATITTMVLRLSSALAEHLVDTAQLRDTHLELERLVHTLPVAPYQRDRAPSQWLLRMLAVQQERIQ